MKIRSEKARTMATLRQQACTLVVISTLLGLQGCAKKESDSMKDGDNLKQSRSLMQNKEIVSKFFEDFSNGQIEEAFSLVSENVKWWVSGNLPFSGTKSKNEYMQVVGSIQTGFPDGLKLVVKSMIAEGNQVAAEVESDGNHVNGKKYENKYHFLIKIENGQMTEVKEYMDTLHLYQLIQP